MTTKPSNKMKTTLNAMIASAFATTLAGTAAASDGHPAKMAEQEKCYGVAKAGMNDCANAAGTHSCAAMASVDSDGGEWISLPKGICEKLAGGSLEPIEAQEDSPAADDAAHQ